MSDAANPAIRRLLEPGASPKPRLAVWLNDYLGPRVAHAAYRATQKPGDQRRLEAARREVPLTPIGERPLVSVRVATFNRAELLVGRALPSVLNQTYDELEVVVVGDHCTDQTAERIEALGDS